MLSHIVVTSTVGVSFRERKEASAEGIDCSSLSLCDHFREQHERVGPTGSAHKPRPAVPADGRVLSTLAGQHMRPSHWPTLVREIVRDRASRLARRRREQRSRPAPPTDPPRRELRRGVRPLAHGSFT